MRLVPRHQTVKPILSGRKSRFYPGLYSGAYYLGTSNLSVELHIGFCVEMMWNCRSHFEDFMNAA